MIASASIALLFGALQTFPSVVDGQDGPTPGATGAPYQGEWAGMTTEIYNGDWDFVHKSPRVTTYLSRARQSHPRKFDVTFTQIHAPDATGQDMTVVVVNYQCDYEKIAILKVQQFAGLQASPPVMSRPAPRDWRGTGAFEVVAARLCGDAAAPDGDPVRGLGSLRRDAAQRPLS